MELKNKRTIGFLCIAISLLFINIIPDPTDAITLPIFSAMTGADISPSNLSVVYMDFIGWSFLIGGILLLLGMYFLNWNVLKLWKKLDIDKYNLSTFLAILSVLSLIFIGIEYAWLLFLVVPIGYWFYIKKDKSEILGLYGTSWIIFLGGFLDLAQFAFKRIPIPEVLPSLSNNIFLGWLAMTLGFSQVTNIVLFIGTFISFLLVILYTKVLKEFF